MQDCRIHVVSNDKQVEIGYLKTDSFFLVLEIQGIAAAIYDAIPGFDSVCKPVSKMTKEGDALIIEVFRSLGEQDFYLKFTTLEHDSEEI